MPNFLDEYLVKLGTAVDQAGFAKFHQALREASTAVDVNAINMAKSLFKAQNEIVAGFAAIGGAAIGLVDKVAMADQEYRLFGLHMYMSTQQARGLKVAMDALGQPLENLAWDPELRGRTKQLLADQRAMAPDGNFEDQMRKVRDIRFEFTRMEVEVQYLGMHVVQDFLKALGMGPDDLLVKLRQFNDWVTKHLPEISAWIVNNFMPVWQDIKMIVGDVVDIMRDFATLFDNIIGMLSGDSTVQGTANFDKFARSVDHVVHWLALAAHFLLQIEGILTGVIGGGGVGGTIGAIIGGIAGIPGGPAGIGAGILAGGATGTGIGAVVGGATGGIFDLWRHTQGGDSSGAASQSLAQQAAALAQQVSAKTGIRADLLWSQWAHETGGFSHIAATNNLAGINVPGGNGSQYRSFDSLNAFGDYYAGMVSRNFPGLKDAGTPEQFASVLKHAGRIGAYYAGSESTYAGGMSRYDKMYNGGNVQVGTITINVQQRPGENSAALAARVKAEFQESAQKRSQRNMAEFADLSPSY